MSDELNRDRQELAGLAQRFGLPQTVSGDPFPPSQVGAPLIVDTDAGDAIALVVAAAEPSLALVSTVDEFGGRRARHLLGLLRRDDVPVVAGTGLREAVAQIVTSTDRLVRWAGTGPATNLAALLTENPALAERLVITQMVGAHDDRAAVNTVLAKGKLPKLVLDIAEDAELHRGLALAVALQLPFVTLRRERVVLDDSGRLTTARDGHLARISVKADHQAFLAWFPGDRKDTGDRQSTAGSPNAGNKAVPKVAVSATRPSSILSEVSANAR
ncbi:nucleoside hydrolase [Lentzea flava]|uniref:Uncharacterized protein n=1 Tax=Lentzea flava TaxID=103732 RepID=A0ABQ2UC24_9PSEU|nr:nucleoside hydrolase [Lentzea flava]MCP2196671.1 hypothetical protein [Lentzea flava]GGU16358.1 hypothetical protein GCM10010178_05010 [Lentzea flava]